jgi:hypothetical protein
MPEAWPLRCPECKRLAEELQEALRFDERDLRERMHGTARAAGRDPEAFRLEWVRSLAQMPDDEFESLQCARYPRVAEVRRKWQAHGLTSGHSMLSDSWRSVLIFDAANKGYGAWQV